MHHGPSLCIYEGLSAAKDMKLEKLAVTVHGKAVLTSVTHAYLLGKTAYIDIVEDTEIRRLRPSQIVVERAAGENQCTR
jgi:hypothetical protein